MNLSFNKSILSLLFVQVVLFSAIAEGKKDKSKKEKGKHPKKGRGKRPNDGQDFSCLRQADFDRGTLIISKSGKYKLCEDVSFFPTQEEPGDSKSQNASSAERTNEQFDPPLGSLYDENAFGLGFFAALSIAADDVTLDLNGFTIQQSKEHALMQRFFAVIELANSPFIQSAGPAQFVGENTSFRTSNNVSILGPGKIGLSAHHGIHGNDNAKVTIQDVTFEDFEVAAVSLNNVDSLVIEDCHVKRNRHDVPIIGMFSAARFISPYGKILKDSGFSMNLRGVLTTAEEVYEKLIEGISNVYEDVESLGYIDSKKHREEYELFHNEFGVVDGPCYTFLVHGKGPAVNEFGFLLNDDPSKTSSDVTIKNNKIENIKCWTNEVPAVVNNNNQKVVTDPRGSVFQFVRSKDTAPISINTDGTYKGNIVADMQIMVAKAIRDGVLENKPELQTENNSIGDEIIEWAESSQTVYNPDYRCHGDSMHHVSKGMVVIRVEDTVGFDISKNKISDVTNLSVPPFSDCRDFHQGASPENAGVPQGANIRGISVAAVTGFPGTDNTSTIDKNRIVDFSSENANIVVGIDVQGKSNSAVIKRNNVSLSKGVGENDDDDIFVAARLRDFVDRKGQDKVKIEKSNKFAHEVQKLKLSSVMIERMASSSSPDNEWVYGSTPGCPFASTGGKNPHGNRKTNRTFDDEL